MTMLHSIYVVVMKVVICAVIFLGVPYLFYRILIRPLLPNHQTEPPDIAAGKLVEEIWKGLLFAFLFLIPDIYCYLMLKHPHRDYGDLVAIFGLLCLTYGVAIQLARAVFAGFALIILFLRNR